MDEEPTLDAVSETDGQPATKADLSALESKVEALKAELVGQIAEESATTRRHFDVVAENIHRDVAGANQDEISLIKDKQADHEHRIAALERS